MMSDRTVFGHPIRESTTRLFHPQKISLEDFECFVSTNIRPFYKNLISNGSKERFIEEWFEIFMAWCEVEEER